MRGDRDRLTDIAAAIETIHSHMTVPAGVARLKHDAVLYNLVIIGEAVKSLGDETRAQRPEVPWRQIAGLRDLLAHEYFRIDMAEVTKIVERDLAPLSEALTALLADARLRREDFIQEGNERYGRAGQDREQAIWDVTLMDGLEAYPYAWPKKRGELTRSGRSRSKRRPALRSTSRRA
ncbi:MAG: DUF86 domain-containing protein [Chloroflexota bacterium]|nr:DUF86 domain-containing protein [Chloroflexota bacterium]